MKNLFNAVCLCLMLVCSNAYAGIFTVTDVTMYDQIYNKTHVYSDCLIDTMKEAFSAISASPSFLAECVSVVTANGTSPPTQAGTMVYYNITIDASVFVRPLHWCRKLVDNTLFVDPPVDRSYSHRTIKFLCNDGNS